MDSVQLEPAVLLRRLRDTLNAAPPFCDGTLALPKDSFQLYYGKETPRFINFSQPASVERGLEELEKACEAAPFGRGQETVMDETYRKAGKMDAEDFVIRLDIERTGLIEAVRTGLLTGPRESKAIYGELYKLNVYSKGAFFKPHLDTPRASNMFGSLVIVLPTPHEGGQLVLRHEGQEWTFDAAQLLAGRTDRIAYIAFFSDVEHEVLPVQSGHRVTATYNLYFASDQRHRGAARGLTVVRPLHANSQAIKEALLDLLRSPKVLPRGGTLGFGLRHVYPLPNTWGEKDDEPLDVVEEGLKGSDAALFYACRELGLCPELRLLTEDFAVPIMLDHVDCFGTGQYEEEEYNLLDNHEGIIVEHKEIDKDGGDREPEVDSHSGSSYAERLKRNYRERLPVRWVTRCNEQNRTCAPYVAYGNEASMGHMYVSVCLVAHVPHTVT